MSNEEECLIEMSHTQAPGLHAALDDLCHKAGMEKPILSFVDHSRISSPYEKFVLENMAGAVTLGKKQHIVLGDKMLEIMGHKNVHSPISEEFKAILAHELGHLKHNDSKLISNVMVRHSPYMGIVAGAAGVWLYGHLKQKEELHRQQGKSEEEIKSLTQQQWEQSDIPKTEVGKSQQHVMGLGKYIAGGLLGMVVGLSAYAFTRRHIEFRADRFSAQLMGSGEPMARALQHVRTEYQKIAMPPEAAIGLLKKGPIGILKELLSHPSDAERLERLGNWSR